MLAGFPAAHPGNGRLLVYACMPLLLVLAVKGRCPMMIVLFMFECVCVCVRVTNVIITSFILN